MEAAWTGGAATIPLRVLWGGRVGGEMGVGSDVRSGVRVF